MKTVEYRPYQNEADHAIEESLSRKQLVVMPTGTGKTVVFGRKAKRDADNGKRVAIAVHRDELVRQTKAKLIAAGLDESQIGIIKAFDNETNKPVTIVSVQTMARKNRSMQYVANGLADLVIIDEAHHAPADSYRNMVDWILKPGGLLIGFTATPDRETQKAYKRRTARGVQIGVNVRSGMAKVFDQVVFYRGLTDMIAEGYLADVVPATIETRLDLGDVAISGGDWQAGELGDAMEKAQADDSIVSSWLRSDAKNRKTLAFLPTIQMSIATRDAFLAAGISAAHIDADTPIDERQEIYQKLRDGEIQVVTNVMVLTEGFDEPSISAIIIARPTQSRLLFAQMIGRGTRLYPGKENVLVMSVVGHSLDLDPITLQSFLDDPGWENEKTLSARKKELAEAQIAADEEAEAERQEAIQFTQNFQKLGQAKLRWSKTNNVYSLSAGDRKHYRIIENGLIQGYRTYDLLDLDGSTIIHEADLALAVSVAENKIRSEGKTIFVDPNAEWLNREPSEAQVWKAGKLGIPVKPGMTRGELSLLIDQKLLSQTPTEKQVRFLRRHGYKSKEEIERGIKGQIMPATKSEATQIIGRLINGDRNA